MYQETVHHRHFALLAASSVLLVFALLRQATAEEPSPDSLTAKQIVKRMAEEYAKCKSYQDLGVVKTVFIRADRKRTVEKPFTTAFVRPDRFRFEYREKKRGNREHRYIVYCNGKDIQTYWDVHRGIRKPESLGRALAGATGVSSSSAHTIPSMLLPDKVGGRRLTDIPELKRIDDAIFDKVDCFRIQDQAVDRPMTLWIDKKQFLLRRIDSQKKFEKFSTQRATTYKPVINGKVTDKMLEFDPPKQN